MPHDNQTLAPQGEAQVRAALVAMLYRMSRQSRYSLFTLLFGLAYLFRDHVPYWQSALLIGYYGGATFVFARLRRAYDAVEKRGVEEATLWGRRYAVLSIATGLAWGATGWLYFFPQEPTLLAFLLGSLFMIVSGAVLMRSPYLPAYYAFIVPVAVPVIVLFFLRGDEVSLAFGIGGTLFCLGLVKLTQVFHRSLYDTLALRFEKEALVQDLVEARKTAEASAEAKERFLANMSHEIRTPLTGVLGGVDLLNGTKLDKEQRGLVDSLRFSTRTLLTVLNDVLDFSKAEAGHLSLEAIPFDLATLTEETRRVMAVTARDKGLELTCEIDPALPARMLGDPVRLQQVLFNLIGNALKFTDRGSVRLRVSKLADDGSAARLKVEVRDTGIGIDEAAQKKLFSAFTQADSSTSRRFGGTGLGLAIAKRLIEAMGGEIGMESAPGRGSTFWFVLKLPVVKVVSRASARGEEADHARDLAGLRVLLADDNPINCKLISVYLEKLECRVEPVGDGRAAVEAVKAGDFDIVLMDIQMPVMDGEAAVRAIRALEGGKGEVPVIALTADVFADRLEDYRKAGFTAILSKPVDWERLCRVLREALSPVPEFEAADPALRMPF